MTASEIHAYIYGLKVEARSRAYLPAKWLIIRLKKGPFAYPTIRKFGQSLFVSTKRNAQHLSIQLPVDLLYKVPTEKLALQIEANFKKNSRPVASFDAESGRTRIIISP